jgi:LemA protein
MTGLWGCFALGVIVLVIAMAVISIYNRLVVLRNRVDNAWSQIDVQLKRRYDLIPNLVESVKGYAAHESGVFEKVTAARAAAINAQGVVEQGQAETMLSGALKSLFAVAEAYPDLKANTNFLDLQAQLTDAENKIAYARQFYNDSVMSLNTAIQSFPSNLLAGMFGFSARSYFEIETAETETPQVKF